MTPMARAGAQARGGLVVLLGLKVWATVAMLALALSGWLTPFEVGTAEAQITFRAASSAGEPGAITFIAAGPQVVSTTKNALLTPQIPAEAQAGDLAIVFLAGRPDNVTEPSAPAGWTLRSSSLQEVGTEDLKVMTFYRVLQGGDSNPSFTVTQAWSGTAGGMSAAVAVWRGVDTATPFDVADVTGNSAAVDQWTPPSISIVTAGALVVSAVATSDDNDLRIGTPNGFTGRMTSTSYHTITGGDHALGVAEYRQPWTGAVTMLTWDIFATNGPDPWAGITFALRPSARALTITKPAGTIENDVMIASIAVRPNTVTITPPADWTLRRRMDSAISTTNSLAVYWKVAGAGEPADYTWTVSATAGAVGGIQSFSGVDTTNPIDIENGGATAPAATHSTPSVTTTVANTMLVTSHGVANRTTWSPPTGMTEAFDIWVYSETIEGNYALQAAAGPTGGKAATDDLFYGDGVDGGNAHILALRPLCPAVSEATYVAASAQAGQVTVYWSSANPVLILRKTAAFAGEAPAQGTTYAVLATIGAATVVYNGSVAETSFTDTGVTNGTTYYYKVFSKAAGPCYAPGTVNPSGGTYATPGTGTGAAQWSYATTAASMAPPGLAPNDVVVAGSNDNKLHGMNAAAFGTQAFAPFPTGGPIQSRPPVIPLEYSTTALDIAYVTSQDGYVYAVNTNTGAQVWQSPLLGTMLQGGAAVWLQAVQALTIGGAATDAVFVGTRNTCGTTSNKVYALNGKNTTVNGVAPGGILWTFNPDPSPPYSVDCISSTPAVDYWNTAVWVTSRSNGGTTTPSLWKLDAATGAVLASWNLGDIDSSPTPSFDGAFMYVGTNAGTPKAIRVSDGTVFTHTPATGTGAIKGLPWPLSYDAVGPGTPDTIIFSRDVTVHSVNFDGSAFTPNWAKTLVSLVQQNTGSATNVSTITVTLTNPTKVGNLLVMVGAGWCGGLLTPTGGGASTWTKATRSNTNTNIEIWYGVVGTSSSTGVTISMDGCGPTSNGMFMNLTEWSGLHATQSQVFDIPGAKNYGMVGTTLSTAFAETGTDVLGDSTPNPTTNANDLLIFGVSQSSTGTFGAPTLGGTPGPWTAMTAITTPAKQSAWYQVVSVTGTYNPDVGVSTAWDAAIAAFKVATVSAPVDDGAGRLYVGGSDGKVHQLDAATGAEQAQVSIVPGAPTVGDPSFDYLLNRIYVGASDGQIYSFGVPF